MAHDNNCCNCGKPFTGNINKRFCSDACRRYYKRHGEVSLAGISKPAIADKAGQARTTPRTGGSSVGNYAAKKGIDLIYQIMSGPTTPVAKSLSLGIATTPTNSPLEMVSAGKAIKDPYSQAFIQKVQLSESFSAFLGNITYPFKALVWGLPGSGKSTFCMQLANELAMHQYLLYVAGEERLDSPTLLDKQRRTLTGANADRCMFLNRLPNGNAEWKQALQFGVSLYTTGCKAIFYDSVTKLGITPFYVDAAANDFQLPDFAKRLSHVFITHAHKDGQQYRGDGSWGHEVDIIIRVEKGTATTEKNRFGEVGRKLTIF